MFISVFSRRRLDIDCHASAAVREDYESARESSLGPHPSA